MPQAVTHFLVPAIIVNLFRDFFVRDKRNFPLHLVLIGGLAGILPDLDFVAYYILGFFGYSLSDVHRTLSHTIWLPIILIILGIILHSSKNNFLGKHHLKIKNVLFIISFGILTHIFLDGLVEGFVKPFYPFVKSGIGFNFVNMIPEHIQATFAASLDAAMLILWIVYIELKHKISSFI